MSRILRFVLPIYLLILILPSCTTKQERIISELSIEIDSLKNIYAPDARIELWKLSLTEKEGNVVLDGMVASEKAYAEVSEMLEERDKEVINNLELLPAENDGRLVTGLINNSVGNMRSEPRHMSDIVSQALLGTPVKILKKERDWYLIQTPNLYLGWIDSAAVESISPDELAVFKKSDKIVYNKQYGFSYTDRDVNSIPVSDLVVGCILPVIITGGDFYQVEYPDGREAWVKKSEVINLNDLIQKVPRGESVIKCAEKFNGIPYLWGGMSSKSIDCSGFSSIVYFLNGMILMRDADQQSFCGKEITSEYVWDSLQMGDLLFFGRPAKDDKPEKVTHVTIYRGGSEFIHASGRVRINSMDPERDNFIPEYPAKFIRTMRIIGIEDKGYHLISDNPFYKEIL